MTILHNVIRECHAPGTLNRNVIRECQVSWNVVLKTICFMEMFDNVSMGDYGFIYLNIWHSTK